MANLPIVDLGDLAGEVVTIGFTELVLIPQGYDEADREAILDRVWPKRHEGADAATAATQ